MVSITIVNRETGGEPLSPMWLYHFGCQEGFEIELAS